MRLLSLVLIIASSLILSACSKDVGFEAHLLEAIEINQSRADTYAALSNERSRKLSNALIFSEQLLLLPARIFDWRGLPFNKNGIGIIEEDFVPMDLEHSASTPVNPAQPYTDDTLEFIDSIIASFHAEKTDLNFTSIADLTADSLNAIEAYEEDNDVYMPMLKHVVESIGFGAVNAILYSCQSDGETDKLARDLAKLQIDGLGFFVVYLDKGANVLHQEGIGFLVNDLPKIPFFTRYDEVVSENQC